MQYSNIIKICLVIPSLQAGGMERVMSELINYFATKKNYEIHLVLYGISREMFYTIPDEIIIHKPPFKFRNDWRILFTIRTLIYLRSTARKISPVTILSFGEYWNSFVILALFGIKIPLYISDRCQPDKRLGGFHDRLRKLLYPRAKGVIAQTSKAKEIYRLQLRHDNIAVIGNPIRNIESTAETVKENIVLMVGRLIKTKHHDKLVEIFLRISNPKWKLVIVGYDHQKQSIFEKLKQIVENNNAEENVELVGKQADVDSYYTRAKIFAFTSSSEGFPNVIGEAMSAGVPCVAFDCTAGPSEMISDNRNGFLVPLFHFRQFQEKLELLMNNEDLRLIMGENAKKDIKEFSISIVGEKYLSFILDKEHN